MSRVSPKVDWDAVSSTSASVQSVTESEGDFNTGSHLTQDIIEQEDLERQRRLKAEEDRAKQNAQDFKSQKNFEKVRDQRLSKLNFLLQQTSTYSSFLANQLLGANGNPEPPKKKRRMDADRLKEADDDRAAVSKGGTNFEQPALLTGATLRDYQLDGVHWLVSLYENGINGILGDEMGLGKTIQTIAFLAHLKQHGVHGPFLVIGPLNTLNNWLREFNKFTPDIAVLLYHGTKTHREELRKKHFKRLGKREDPRIPVIITSYEITLKDSSFLRRYDWKIIVVDEGHRLKNKDCILLRELMNYKSSNRLLLSGTPLQNNLKELWSLLHFLLPDIFNSVEDFESWFNFLEIDSIATKEEIIQKETQENFVTKLHSILKPFLLRRVKTDVECSLPPKKEILLFTHLTPLQRQYYTALLKERSDVDEDGKGAMKRLMEEKGLERNATKSASMSLQSIVVQLRKCCNHPYLFGESRGQSGEFETNDDIVKSCGKLMLLDKLLPKLKEGGHKVLLFSQMTQLLDIFEDYCILRGYQTCRLDGTTSHEDRVAQMDSFNSDPEKFIFLLSTKAGGVGVNLCAADTVVFYDSDWNPHQDLQAQDRCHRIGQTRPVMVYRLITRPSIEERMIERANSKRKLDKMVIQKGAFKGRDSIGKQTNLSVSDLEAILTEEIFSQSSRAVHEVMCDKEIEEILNRTHMDTVNEGRCYKVMVHQVDQLLKGVSSSSDAVSSDVASADAGSDAASEDQQAALSAGDDIDD
eukprot:c11844_g1_i1.p1 GENE.c11844_g1_i1~~c11844_g1_i1.p1  ORF type:complete len:753 (+),score=122.10 c11844_g1_i1:129-2387(+)